MFKKRILFLLIASICLYSEVEASRIDDVINKIISTRGSVKIGFIPVVKATGMEDLAATSIDRLEEEALKALSKDKNGDKIKVIERSHLNKIIEEQKLITSGITTSETIEIGRIAGLDLIFLVIFYPENITIKVLAVETGEILLTQRKDFEIPKSNLVTLENSSFSVPPGRYIEYHWNLKAGTVLNIAVRSNSDVNVWLLDDINYYQFPKGNWRYFPKASGQRIYNADFVFIVPVTGRYHYIFDNRFSVISSKGVALTVIANEPN